ncbi:pectate lyase [Treponema zioleckii]|uniref:pectate lyase n=1 Tax=Treponema zioleckii TaxID=331680 RepID=UPI00168B0A41|nr:pectate lyase [Treponema zioleckii]
MVKSSFIKMALGLLAFGTISLATAQDSRKPWNEVPNPTITNVSVDPNDGKVIVVDFEADTPRDNSGSDKGFVSMKGDNGASGNASFGKTRKAQKKVTFEVEKSGKYTFVVYAERNKESEKHASEPFEFNYTLPLDKSAVSVRNTGSGNLFVSWTAVPEAEGYVLSYTDASGKNIDLPQSKNLNANVKLPVGTLSTFKVTAIRGEQKSVSKEIKKTSREAAERIWTFTQFGTSTKDTRNRMELLDSDNLKVKLYSCIVDEKTGAIVEKGGKFESFFDGLSFYYTTIDPKKENWELTATVTVDYQNPLPDGQEGFGLIAMDKLGIDNEPMVVAYTNSAGIISRKYTTHVNGVKKEIKNGLGARFVSGLTDEVVKMGDSGISTLGKSVSNAFSYDQASDAIKSGDVYRITLKKDNTGYHAIYKRAVASEDSVEEFIMYDNENQKLVQLDKEHVYVGLAVARGVNATFSDIDFKVTDPKKDPPAVEEPPELVPLATLIDCPVSWYEKKYPFVFHANANGVISIKDSNGKVLVKGDKVVAEQDYKKTLKIEAPGFTDLLVTFKPDENWRPEPKSVIAQYNRELGIYEKNYKAVTYTHSITVLSCKNKEIYVSPNGNIFGKGTRDDPWDLESALLYCKPGQPIIMLEGRYYPTKGITIERGNDGTAKKRKSLKAEPGKRVVIDFSSSSATVSAINLYGSYWDFENIDITKSPENCKALQVAGNYNRIRMVDTYLNGDTGIQISGRSSEPFEKWPHDNLIYGCESFGNADPAQNNADGFASKLTSGNNNVFRNCVSHHNVDDGWDLYAKVETGPIGAVLLENCVTYANGTKLDGSGKGDGNGFKLGGDGINVPHLLKNSISWGNGVNGITCNSNPGLQLENVISAFNGQYGITLYGKGKAESYPRTFKVKGAISFANGAGDDLKEVREFCPELISDDNYFFTGAKTLNKSGKAVDEKSAFVSIDVSKYANGYNADGTFNRIPRNEKGEFLLGDLFKKTASAPGEAGVNYNNVNIDAK